MMVSPFTRSTSYTFKGSCERVLLQSCNPSIDFMVRVDFITDSMENGAVGVFLVSGRGITYRYRAAFCLHKQFKVEH